VLLLADEGKLALDELAAKYLDLPESWQGIWIRHLLTHTSGLGDYPEDFSLQRDYTEDDLLKMIKAQPLGFPPGAKPRLRDARHPHPQGHRPVLRRLPLCRLHVGVRATRNDRRCCRHSNRVWARPAE
jgi:beta-lactamase family protein